MSSVDMNVVDPILFQCRFHPSTAAMFAPGPGIGLISYGRLENYIHNVARSALAAGIAEGDAVAVRIRDPILHAIVLLALAHLRIATFSADDERDMGDMAARTIVTDAPVSTATPRRVILADYSWTTGDGTPISRTGAARPGGGMLRLFPQRTRGDGAQIMALTHEVMRGRIGQSHSAFGHRFVTCQRVFSDIGLRSAFGCQVMLDVLGRGGMVIFGGEPFEQVLDAFAKYRVQSWMTSAAGLLKLSGSYKGRRAHPDDLELAIGIGPGLAGPQSQLLRNSITPNIVAAYETGATGVIAAGPLIAIGHEAGAVGYVAPDVAVQIVDDAGKTLAHGQQGTIRVQSSHQATVHTADGAPASPNATDGWLYTGDTGCLTPDGTLVVHGAAT